MPRRPSPDTTIGERIKVRRQLRKWSMRLAADRAGIAHTTWSRIERGLMACDNRFLVADIAAALECSVADLTGGPVGPVDELSAEVYPYVNAIRQALVEVDLGEEPMCSPRPVRELARETALVEDLRRRCDYLGVVKLLPRLLVELHASARGRNGETALRCLVMAMFATAGTVRYLTSPAESWLAAERCRQAAEALEDPVLLALAAYERATPR